MDGKGQALRHKNLSSKQLSAWLETHPIPFWSTQADKPAYKRQTIHLLLATNTVLHFYKISWILFQKKQWTVLHIFRTELRSQQTPGDCLSSGLCLSELRVPEPRETTAGTKPLQPQVKRDSKVSWALKKNKSKRKAFVWGFSRTQLSLEEGGHSRSAARKILRNSALMF